jgi:hypothetical protein
LGTSCCRFVGQFSFFQVRSMQFFRSFIFIHANDSIFCESSVGHFLLQICWAVLFFSRSDRCSFSGPSFFIHANDSIFCESSVGHFLLQICWVVFFFSRSDRCSFSSPSFIHSCR